MGSDRRAGARFEGEGSTLLFAAGGAQVAVTVMSPHIVRVEWLDGTAGPSYVGPHAWPAARVETVDGDPVPDTGPPLSRWR